LGRSTGRRSPYRRSGYFFAFRRRDFAPRLEGARNGPAWSLRRDEDAIEKHRCPVRTGPQYTATATVRYAHELGWCRPRRTRTARRATAWPRHSSERSNAEPGRLPGGAAHAKAPRGEQNFEEHCIGMVTLESVDRCCAGRLYSDRGGVSSFYCPKGERSVR